MEGDSSPPRKQTYVLAGKHAYVAPDDRFVADATVLAGAPRGLANLTRYLGDLYNPLDHISADSPLDRYAAVKALRFRTDLHARALPMLERSLDAEKEIRVRLEAAGTAAMLGSSKGEGLIADVLWATHRPR
jgi:uncharacterized membrane protein